MKFLHSMHVQANSIDFHLQVQTMSNTWLEYARTRFFFLSPSDLNIFIILTSTTQILISVRSNLLSTVDVNFIL